jgi:xylan 1,4-beta-xylosidase
VGHANISGVNDWTDKQGAWMQELDLEQKKLVGKRKQLTHGHASNARRIEHHAFRAATKLVFNPKKENEQAGLVIYRRSENHYQLLKQKEEIVRIPYENSEVVLFAEANDLDLQFSYGSSLEDLKPMGPVQNMNVISDELAGGFNGPYVGMYATSNGSKSKTNASFEWFEYEESN